jgi:hypothetical protein
MPSVGDKIDRRKLQARWAYCELTSPRFGGHYRNFPGGQPLFEKAKAGVAFEQLASDEIARLQAMNACLRKPLLDDYEIENVTGFVCQAISKADLQHISTLGFFDPDGKGRLLTFGEFVTASYKRDGNGNPEPGDPRVACASAAGEFSPTEPPIIWPYRGHRVPMEGYFRSLMFNRSANPDDELLVWDGLSGH